MVVIFVAKLFCWVLSLTVIGFSCLFLSFSVGFDWFNHCEWYKSNMLKASKYSDKCQKDLNILEWARLVQLTFILLWENIQENAKCPEWSWLKKHPYFCHKIFRRMQNDILFHNTTIKNSHMFKLNHIDHQFLLQIIFAQFYC